MTSRLFIVMMSSHSAYIFLVNLLGLKAVRLVVLGFGCGVVEKIGRCCILLWVLSILAQPDDGLKKAETCSCLLHTVQNTVQ